MNEHIEVELLLLYYSKLLGLLVPLVTQITFAMQPIGAIGTRGTSLKIMNILGWFIIPYIDNN